MEHLQNLLSHIVDLGARTHTDELGDWYPLLVNDSEEWNQPRPAIGLTVRIDGEPGNYRVTGVNSYNR